MSLLDYSFCRQSVTVYRFEKGAVQRLVVPGCYYAWEDRQEQDVYGPRHDRKFLLIMPGCCQRVFPGDRIYEGVGPETVDWENFLPVNVPGLGEVAYVRPWFWDGMVSHLEAGRK